MSPNNIGPSKKKAIQAALDCKTIEFFIDFRVIERKQGQPECLTPLVNNLNAINTPDTMSSEQRRVELSNRKKHNSERRRTSGKTINVFVMSKIYLGQKIKALSMLLWIFLGYHRLSFSLISPFIFGYNDLSSFINDVLMVLRHPSNQSIGQNIWTKMVWKCFFPPCAMHRSTPFEYVDGE